MYPLKDGQTYPLNHWYVAATANEVGRDLMARRILGLPIVFYRTEAGQPVAFHDVCPHRRFPLSKSKLVGDAIQCGYHGFTYDSSGKCIKLPTGDRVPTNYGVRSFPLVERWQWIWIWTGHPDLADPSKIPDHSLMRVQSDGWDPTFIGMTTMKARHMLLHENLLDLSHLTYLHDGSIGSAGVATTRMEIEDKGSYLEITRRIRNDSMDGVPLGHVLGIEGLVDRLMVQQFFAPSFHATGSAFTRSSRSDSEPGHYYGGFRVLHGVTPETPNSTHYFYAFSRDFAIGNTVVRDKMAETIENAVAEDIYASEQLEQMIVGHAKPSEDIHSRADAGSLRGRVVVEKLIEAENLAAPINRDNPSMKLTSMHNHV